MSHRTWQKRLVVIDYNPSNLPTFGTSAEIDEYHRALGRMVAYGLLHEAEEDTVQLVQAALATAPLEICATYHQPISSQRERYADGQPKYIGSSAERNDNFLNAVRTESLSRGRPFVMAAILHQDGKWAFHS